MKLDGTCCSVNTIEWNLRADQIDEESDARNQYFDPQGLWEVRLLNFRNNAENRPK